MGQEIEPMTEEDMVDWDEEYERERDFEAQDLDDDIQALHKKYVVDGRKPMGYYKNSLRKFIDHATSMLNFIKDKEERRKNGT